MAVVDRDRGVALARHPGAGRGAARGHRDPLQLPRGQKSDERDALKHGVFTFSVLEALRDAERTGRDLTWDWLVAATKDSMAGLIEADQQEPIAAGAVGRIVLGRRGTSPTARSRPDHGHHAQAHPGRRVPDGLARRG